LDFWGILFRCAACHKTSHLIKNCPSHKLYNNRLLRQNMSRQALSTSPSSLEKREGHLLKSIASPQVLTQDPPLFPGTRSSNPENLNSPLISSPIAFQCSPIPEPRDDQAIPSSSPMWVKDFSVGSIPIPITSSSPPLDQSLLFHIKGKEPCVSVTPVDSPASSPVNPYDGDLDLLLNRKSLELEPLTIHKPRN